LAQQKVDQKKIDAAIEKGARYLLGYLSQHQGPIDPQKKPGKETYPRTAEELVLYTLIHAKVKPTNPEFKKLLDKLLKADLKWTYNVALLAMALEALDKEQYQYKIVDCAQFLVDQQCQNGQWDYGTPVKGTAGQPTGEPSSEPKSGETRSVKRVNISRRGKGPASGDNSNTQYALLGLRACMDARVVIPDETFKAARDWLIKDQNSDGGWGYTRGSKTATAVSYGSMSAGGLGALAICEYYLGVNFKKDTNIQRGIDWLANNFTVTDNPNKTNYFHYYYLYALERAGMLSSTETFGQHDWYTIGAKYLLKEQKPDGSWESEKETWESSLLDTCFAILFLRRATKPIPIISGADEK
jgi:hypothetical protein